MNTNPEPLQTAEDCLPGQQHHWLDRILTLMNSQPDMVEELTRLITEHGTLTPEQHQEIRRRLLEKDCHSRFEGATDSTPDIPGLFDPESQGPINWALLNCWTQGVSVSGDDLEVYAVRGWVPTEQQGEECVYRRLAALSMRVEFIKTLQARAFTEQEISEILRREDALMEAMSGRNASETLPSLGHHDGEPPGPNWLDEVTRTLIELHQVRRYQAWVLEGHAPENNPVHEAAVGLCVGPFEFEGVLLNTGPLLHWDSPDPQERSRIRASTSSLYWRELAFECFGVDLRSLPPDEDQESLLDKMRGLAGQAAMRLTCRRKASQKEAVAAEEMRQFLMGRQLGTGQESRPHGTESHRRYEPSPDPFALRNPLPYVSSPPAAGAVSAILRARNWETDEEGRFLHVHSINGSKQKGRISYRILLQNGDALELAERELALEILKRMGLNTAWLHMLFLAYTARLGKGEHAVISREMVWRALNLRDDHRSANWKNQQAQEEIRGLASLGLSIDRLTINGKECHYDRKITALWRIDFYGFGQGLLFDEGQMVPGYQDWQLLVEPGGWADTFLYGDQTSRQLGYMASQIFEKVDRARAPWGAVLALLLTFKARYTPGQSTVRVTNQELIEFAGGEINPTDKHKRESNKLQLRAAWEEQRKWGCEPDYTELPAYLRPDLDFSSADDVARGEGRAMPRKPLPRGYYDGLLQAGIRFRIPPVVVEHNRKAAALPTDNPPAALQGRLHGEAIKAIRAQHDMSQRQLAEHLEVSPAMVGMMEKNLRSPNPRILKKLRQLQASPPH